MVPSGNEVCEIQLFKMIHKVHNVEVNESEIERFLPKIYDELSDLSKEDVIKRFVSLEFNRFLEYYRKSPDLNVDPAAANRRDGDRPGRDGERSSRSYGNSDRLFVNIGKMDDLDVPQLIRFVASNANVDGGAIGKIDLKGVYSFFEIDKGLTDKVMKGLNGAKFHDRTVRVELAGASNGGDEGRSSSGGYKGKRRDDGGGYKGGSGGGYSRDSRGGSGGGYKGSGGGDRERRSGGDSGYGRSRPRKSY